MPELEREPSHGYDLKRDYARHALRHARHALRRARS